MSERAQIRMDEVTKREFEEIVLKNGGNQLQTIKTMIKTYNEVNTLAKYSGGSERFYKIKRLLEQVVNLCFNEVCSTEQAHDIAKMELSEEIAEKDMLIRTITEELEKQKTVTDQLLEKNKKLMGEIENTKVTVELVENYKNQLHIYQTENEKLKEGIEELKVLKAEVISEKKKVEVFEKEKAAFDERYEKVKNKLSYSEEEALQYKNKVTILSETINKLHQEKQNMYDELSTYRAKDEIAKFYIERCNELQKDKDLLQKKYEEKLEQLLEINK